MKKRLIIITVLLTLISSAVANSNQDQQVQNKLQELVKQAIVQYHLPSLSISYKLPGKPIMTIIEGYSDLSPLTPIKPNALYPAASISKSFTSVLILRLQQQGKLSLNDHLDKFAHKGSELANWIRAYPFLKQINLRELLNHTSGVPAAVNTPLFAQIFVKHPEKCYSDNYFMTHVVFKQKPYFKPGSDNYQYTNTDYMLAAAVVSAVTHKSYHDNVIALLASLGFKDGNTYFPQGCKPFPKWLIDRLPHGYMLSNMQWPQPMMDVLAKYPHRKIPGSKLELFDVSPITYADNNTTTGANGWITSTANMVRWYEAIFQGNVLNEHSKQALLYSIPTQYGFDYGLGVTVRYSKQLHDTIISHDGSLNGFRANLIYLKRRNIIIALATNSANNAIELDTPLANKIINALTNGAML